MVHLRAMGLEFWAAVLSSMHLCTTNEIIHTSQPYTNTLCAFLFQVQETPEEEEARLERFAHELEGQEAK